MKPSEIRRHVLTDHEMLRGVLSSLEALSRQVRDGERELAGALRVEAEGLLERLGTHMEWEDRYLAPALRRADAWGEERAALLDADHREQRVLLEHTLAGLRDESRPTVLLARTLLDFVSLLRQDMEDEERDLLDERILRDDVVVIDASTG